MTSRTQKPGSIRHLWHPETTGLNDLGFKLCCHLKNGWSSTSPRSFLQGSPLIKFDVCFFCGASEVRTLVKFLGLTGSAFRHSTSCLSVTQIWSGPCHANFIHQDEFLTWLAPKWTNGTDRLLELKSSIRSKFNLTISDQCPDVVCL